MMRGDLCIIYTCCPCQPPNAWCAAHVREISLICSMKLRSLWHCNVESYCGKLKAHGKNEIFYFDFFVCIDFSMDLRYTNSGTIRILRRIGEEELS